MFQTTLEIGYEYILIASDKMERTDEIQVWHDKDPSLLIVYEHQTKASHRKWGCLHIKKHLRK